MVGLIRHGTSRRLGTDLALLLYPDDDDRDVRGHFQHVHALGRIQRNDPVRLWDGPRLHPALDSAGANLVRHEGPHTESLTAAY